MLRLKLMFIPTVVLIFAAGLVVGRITNHVPTVSQNPATRPTTRPHGPSALHDQLGLNAEQRQQMDAIWADVWKNGNSFDKRRQLDRDRDQAIQALLTPEQKTQYDAIQETNRVKRAELDKERDKLIAEANEKSKALLNDEQKKKWDELTKEMREHRGPGGPRGRDRGQDRMGPGGTDRPPTRPANLEPPKP